MGDADIFYVCEKHFNSVKEKLKKNEDKDDTYGDLVKSLTIPDDLADDEQMIPVDMRGIEGDFEDVESMVEKLGAKATAEAFVKAREYFLENKDKEPDDDRPQPMTAGEWQAVLNDGLEGEEEEFPFLEGEEEELCDDEDDGGEEEAGADDEPAAKKAKTD